jgi:hypothetical protein
MDLMEAIARSNGLSIWKLDGDRWQVSIKNKDGSFAITSGPLESTLRKALGIDTEKDEYDGLDLI